MLIGKISIIVIIALSASVGFAQETDRKDSESFRIYERSKERDQYNAEVGTHHIQSERRSHLFPRGSWDQNIETLKKEWHSEKASALLSAKETLEKEPDANPRLIKEFMGWVSDAAVAEGDQRATIFGSAADIVKTYHDAKAANLMSVVYKVLIFYNFKFRLTRLPAVAGENTYREAVVSYTTYLKNGLLKLDEAGELKNRKAIEETPEEMAEDLLTRHPQFGVGGTQSKLLGNSGR